MDKRNPIEDASCFSNIFYFWLNPIFAASRKKQLTSDDVIPAPSVESSQHVIDRLEQEWDKERSKKNPSFLRAVFKAHIYLLFMTAISIFLEMICYSFRPFVIQRILLGFSDMSLSQNKIETTLFSLLLLVLTLLILFLRNASFWMTYRMGMRLRVAASGLIYKKILRLNQKSLMDTAAGQVINLISTDVQRFELTFMFIHYGWIGPLQAVAVFWLMSQIDLYPTLCAAAVMTLFIPMQTLMNRAYAKLKFRISKVTDKRIRILSDIINGVKIIKLHAWEKLFSQMVNEVRKRETRLILYVRLCQAFQFTQLVYQVKVTTMAMLIAMVLLHNGPGDPVALQSHQLYTLINYINSLFLSLTLFMPMCIQYFYDTKVSCRRIQEFLQIPEIDRERKPHTVRPDPPQLQFYDVSASWTTKEGHVTLKNISFDVRGPQLIAVVGTVGSGKSSLLQVALGELPHFDGFVLRSSNVAYMPQMSWIFPGTVRENVLCSLPYDHERYKQVLKATTLDMDLKLLAHGDHTQVGERGVSLSGGQKARIGLARVAYDRSTFVLLDDPLAAVDARVANHLFNECICGMLANRLRLLVTHQHHLLPRMDKIIVMKDGTIAHFGTYEQLVAEGVNFHSLFSEAEDRMGESISSPKSTTLTLNEDSMVSASASPTFKTISEYIDDDDDEAETALLQSEQQQQEEKQQQKPSRLAVLPPSLISDHTMPEADAQRHKSKESLESGQDNEPSSVAAFSSTRSIGELCRRLDWSFKDQPNTLRKRTLSTLESGDKTRGSSEAQEIAPTTLLVRSMSQRGSSKTRRSFIDQESLRSFRINTPRGSICSRLAFGLENALAPGLLSVEDSTMDAIDSYVDDSDPGLTVQRKKPGMETIKAELLHSDEAVKEEEGLIKDTTVAEEWQHGAVKLRHYLTLGRIAGGFCGIWITLFLFVLTITNYAGCDVWIAKWSANVDERAFSNVSNSNSTVNPELSPWDIRSNLGALILYCGLTALLVILSSLRSLTFFGILINAAKRIHKGMLNGIMKTRLSFFEVNTSGRILNRFSKDIGQLDDYLPTTIHDFLQTFFLVISIGVVTVMSSYWMILPTVPLLCLFYIIRRYYLFTSRDLKRIESVARSPVFSWVNVTIQGLPCIRASGTEAHHLRYYNQFMDEHSSVFYMNIAAARWLSIRLDLMCAVYIAAVLAVCLLMGNFSDIKSSDVGLMITYATGLIGLFQWCVRQSAEVENQMVSVERTVEYMELAPELTEPPILEPPALWPSRGKIEFVNLSLRYNQASSWALYDINLKIEEGQKVGIVGRTGAGKSSLISAIFRLVEAEKGQILVDDVDIAHLDLSELRKRISIIPQDPIMFSGTIRTNLDPDCALSDETIWDALASVQLDKMISGLAGGLNASISEGGTNFSTGQRQLLALARAILGGNRILVVDEATANVDPGTDFVIQKTLRSQFASCTVLTVAHRLHTVIDNELLVVMEGGRVIEVGPPHELLNPEWAKRDRALMLHGKRPIRSVEELQVSGTGPLAALVRQTGTEEASILAQMARNAYIRKIRHRTPV